MAATLQDLIRYRGLSQAGRDAIDAPFFPNKHPLTQDPSWPKPEPEAPQAPQWLAEALAKLDDMTARCDALIERNGRWTRYVTGVES